MQWRKCSHRLPGRRETAEDLGGTLVIAREAGGDPLGVIMAAFHATNLLSLKSFSLVSTSLHKSNIGASWLIAVERFMTGVADSSAFDFPSTLKPRVSSIIFDVTRYVWVIV